MITQCFVPAQVLLTRVEDLTIHHVVPSALKSLTEPESTTFACYALNSYAEYAKKRNTVLEATDLIMHNNGWSSRVLYQDSKYLYIREALSLPALTVVRVPLNEAWLSVYNYATPERDVRVVYTSENGSARLLSEVDIRTLSQQQLCTVEGEQPPASPLAIREVTSLQEYVEKIISVLKTDGKWQDIQVISDREGFTADGKPVHFLTPTMLVKGKAKEWMPAHYYRLHLAHSRNEAISGFSQVANDHSRTLERMSLSELLSHRDFIFANPAVLNKLMQGRSVDIPVQGANQVDANIAFQFPCKELDGSVSMCIQGYVNFVHLIRKTEKNPAKYMYEVVRSRVAEHGMDDVYVVVWKYPKFILPTVPVPEQ